ncbi:hypothetical protein [Psychromicrobium sp. YIM B11713]|uniref:hypothetical protein n=1 Tax=Psychromicrobium sp. YIM B11713 TaxID=3145233 RepID=UPI00374FAF53
MSSLRFSDPQTVADFRTFVSRARAADDGAIRLQSNGTVLAAWVCSMRPRLLGEGTPTILGLRTMALVEHINAGPTDSEQSDIGLDCTVPLAAVADRLARLHETDTELPIPTVTVNESWAALSAPRADWRPEIELAADQLIAVAKEGVREIAQIIPVNPGALIVNNARAAVWGRDMPGLSGLPGGAAFAGYALGFWRSGEHITFYRSGRWIRLSSAHGHVLVRPPSTL